MVSRLQTNSEVGRRTILTSNRDQLRGSEHSLPGRVLEDSPTILISLHAKPTYTATVLPLPLQTFS
ncbi:hypothetical protein M413DRAFT_437996 [Hebeloma cylindrosporum]|uniref:Uncharacterized protein n=1 Tax=Hebeloma cylindrosporum TaxID=76867 RepID=A0A0C3CJD6_HEBCY|nr:hypothetical protein M413DRAFT_437996 [Hebeloma cylindrosporum h7]